jgi:hypothetical protein
MPAKLAPKAGPLPGKRAGEGFATPKISGIEAVYAERLRSRIQTELAHAQSERSQVRHMPCNLMQ